MRDAQFEGLARERRGGMHAFRASPKSEGNGSCLALRTAGGRMIATVTEESQQKTVLVVDDSAEILTAVRLSLEANGFRVLQANDPFTGVRLAASREPDAIVMDLDMPGMDGVETVKYLKRIERTRGIPVIAFTGQLHALAGRLTERGFERVVDKADGLENLESEIEEVIEHCAA
ncbi:MAG: response regulator [Acidobacteria bacterium]|nr:response regulator [Acidobacteriota bacterium]